MNDVVMRTLHRDTKCIVISPDDETAYCGTSTGDIMQVAVRTKLFKALGPEKPKFSNGVISIALMKNGDLVAGAGDGTVSIIKPATWKSFKTAKVSLFFYSCCL